MLSIENIKNLVSYKIKPHLSKKQFSLLRLIYSSITSPKYLKSHQNNFKYSESVFRDAVVSEFVTPVFTVSVNDSCNLRCPNCLYLLENPDKFFNSHIPLDKFREALEKFDKDRDAETIFLTGGEALIHPQFEELVDICREYNFRFIRVATNGVLVKRKISAIAKLDSINISMDSYDSATFHKYRGGTEKQFNQIVEGLEALNEKGIEFSLSYVLSAENFFEVPKMIEFSEKAGASLVHFHNINPHGSDEFTPLMVNDENTVQFLNDLLSKTDYSFDIELPVIFDQNARIFDEGGCNQPWSQLVFNSLGKVAYCCHLDQDEAIGNVFNEYDRNSAKMKEFRKAIISGEQSEMVSCRFCQRRFMGHEFGRFDSSVNQWFINEEYSWPAIAQSQHGV